MQRSLSGIKLVGGILDGEQLPSDNLTPLAYVSVQESTDIHYTPECLCEIENEAEYVGAGIVVDPIKVWHTYQRSHRDRVSGDWIFIPREQD